MRVPGQAKGSGLRPRQGYMRVEAEGLREVCGMEVGRDASRCSQIAGRLRLSGELRVVMQVMSPQSSLSETVSAERFSEEKWMTTKENFEVGETLYLKSGGPLMTVEAIADNAVFCCWIADDGTIFRSGFPPACLIGSCERER